MEPEETSLQLSFRAAALADVPAIVAMLADDALGRGREAPGATLHPAYAAAFEAIAADANQFLAVAELAGEVVGTLQVSFLPGLSHLGAWRGEIEAVRVASAWRGQGVGAWMLRCAIERCRARGCRMVQLTTNAARADAQRFYERLGFSRSHVGFKLGL